MFSDRIIYLRETTKKKGEKKEEHTTGWPPHVHE